MELNELEIYRIANEISDIAWTIYGRMDWQIKKIIGDQFISAVDSVSANIAEGFGRFHYLDKNKFNYNARGSLFETHDWLGKLHRRKLITFEEHEMIQGKLDNLGVKLNNYIRATKHVKDN